MLGRPPDPGLEFHGLIEFGNRLVTVVITVVVIAAFLGSIFRGPRRRDLVWLSGGLVAGVLAQAVLGGIVVYTKLNPYLVMVHFFATMLLLVDAVSWSTVPPATTARVRRTCWCRDP